MSVSKQLNCMNCSGWMFIYCTIARSLCTVYRRHCCVGHCPIYRWLESLHCSLLGYSDAVQAVDCKYCRPSSDSTTKSTVYSKYITFLTHTRQFRLNVRLIARSPPRSRCLCCGSMCSLVKEQQTRYSSVLCRLMIFGVRRVPRRELHTSLLSSSSESTTDHDDQIMMTIWSLPGSNQPW